MLMLGFNESSFLNHIYEAPADPSIWVTVMEHLSDLMNAGGGVWLSSLSVVSGRGAGILARTHPDAFDVYFDYYATRNPLLKVDDPQSYLRTWQPTILTDEDWMPREELAKTEFYNDFLRPLGADSTAMI